MTRRYIHIPGLLIVVAPPTFMSPTYRRDAIKCSSQDSAVDEDSYDANTTIKSSAYAKRRVRNENIFEVNQCFENNILGSSIDKVLSLPRIRKACAYVICCMQVFSKHFLLASSHITPIDCRKVSYLFSKHACQP